MHKKYGVWGLGVVGKSVLTYLHNQGHELTVMDKRAPTEQETLYLNELGIQYIPQTNASLFFEQNDFIVASPGIDITPAQRQYGVDPSKFVEELDLFAQEWKKPLIAVTGTLGKTSVVHMLSTILQENNVAVATGGNIGTGMLDLLKEQEKSDCALLELSSFQLDRSTRFAPDLAIWTNLYPNHLDRHGSMENYFQAKCRLLQNQHDGQQALVPLSLAPMLRGVTDRPLNFFSTEPGVLHNLLRSATLSSNQHSAAQVLPEQVLGEQPSTEPCSIVSGKLLPEDRLYVLQDKSVLMYQGNETKELFTFKPEQLTGYKENWLIQIAACHILGLTEKRSFKLPEVTLPAHRLEKVTEINGITFYNDSKSSVMEATIAAVEQLQPSKIHLMLGGISKGVARTELIGQLKGKVSSITCFGSEAEELFQACRQVGIETTSCKSLEEAFEASVAQGKETILFSPAGASFDLFKNYVERGNRFKELVNSLARKKL